MKENRYKIMKVQLLTKYSLPTSLFFLHILIAYTQADIC